MNISQIAIKRPVTTIMLVLMIIVLGVVSLMGLSIDMLPDVTFPMAVVITNYDGAGPKEVETLITKPLEEVLGTVSNFKNVTSTSSNGSSMVMVEFTQGTNMDFAALNMREKIDMVKDALPEDADAPIVFQFDPDLMPIMQFSVSNGDNLVELKNLAEEEVKNRLERLDGVASVSTYGGLEREIKINIVPDKLDGYGLTMTQIIQTLRAENLTLPGGEVEQGKSQFTVRTTGEFSSIDEISNFPISTAKGVVSLKDIAYIEDGYKEMSGSVYMNGKPCLFMIVQKQSGTNTVKVSDKINKELIKIKQDIPELNFETVFDQADFIKKSINSVVNNAILGGILAVLILYLFLKNVRTTFIIATSIPISIIATFVLIYFSGITLNMMSLGGLALGVGMLVDNSIVVLESIYRYREEGYGIIDAAREGSSEVAMAVTASTLTTIAVFLPIAFIRDNLSIELFREMALTVTFSVFASLVVSLTLVPMLSSKILKVTHSEDIKKENIFKKLDRLTENAFSGLESAYERLLKSSLAHRKRVLLFTVILLVISIVLASFSGAEFFPSADQGQFTINVELPKGTVVEETAKVIDTIERRLSTIPEMEYLMVLTGMDSGGFGSSTQDSSLGQMYGSFGSKLKRQRGIDEILDEVRSKITDIPGAKISVAKQESFGGMMGGGSAISVLIKGDDLNVLKDISEVLVEKVSKVPGAREVKSSIGQTVPEVLVKIDRNKAAQYGLSSYTVANAVQTAIMGQTATRYKIEGDEINVKVRFDEVYRKNVSDLNNIIITSPMGQQLPLYEIADLVIDESPISIRRENQVRVVSVTGDIFERSPGEVSIDIQKIIDSMLIPQGYEVKLGGVTEDMIEAAMGFAMAFILAVILVYMIMASQFESLVDPFVIMFSVPLAFIGVALAMAIARKPFSVPALIGVIVLAGIVVNNAIVLVDYINILKSKGMDRNEAIIKAGPVRLRPILMTTLTTVLGLIPLALGIGEGAEMQAPLAITVIGGLTFSTLLTLVFIPVMYTLFDDFGIWSKKFFTRNKKTATQKL